jgi:hypothetical protein
MAPRAPRTRWTGGSFNHPERGALELPLSSRFDRDDLGSSPIFHPSSIADRFSARRQFSRMAGTEWPFPALEKGDVGMIPGVRA